MTMIPIPGPLPLQWAIERSRFAREVIRQVINHWASANRRPFYDLDPAEVLGGKAENIAHPEPFRFLMTPE